MKQSEKGPVGTREVLDCIGLTCPHPLMRIKERMAKLAAGDVLEVLTDDPMARTDLPEWCARSGFAILGAEEDGGVMKFLIGKTPPA